MRTRWNVSKITKLFSHCFCELLKFFWGPPVGVTTILENRLSLYLRFYVIALKAIVLRDNTSVIIASAEEKER